MRKLNFLPCIDLNIIQLGLSSINIASHINLNIPPTGFDYKTCNVLVSVDEQSSNIADGVHVNKIEDAIGAGDQVGYWKNIGFGGLNDWQKKILWCHV